MTARVTFLPSLTAALIALAAFAIGCSSSNGTNTVAPATSTATSSATTLNTLNPADLRASATRRGTCFSPSSATRRTNAWPCSFEEALPNGATLVDPCYRATSDATSVLCPTTYPPENDAVRIELDLAPDAATARHA